MKKMLKKRGSSLGKRGFTLAELLMATAVLALFISMAAVGTSALFGTGEEMMAVSKAAVLGSDVMEIIKNEVRFGEEFAVESDGTLKFSGTTYGADCYMKVGEGDHAGQLVVVKQQTAVDGSATDEKPFFPIGTAAYDEVRIKSLVFTVTDGAGGQVVTVTLSITSDGVKTLWENTASMSPLAQKTSL